MFHLGRYEIENELDRGVLTATYRARDTAGKVVAVRTVQLTALSDEAERKELRRGLHENAKALTHLAHPNVVPVRDVIEEREFVHFVSDFVEAPRLGDILKPGQPVASGIAITWLQQLASALDAAHQRAIVHGAFWPNNIFVENSSPLNVSNGEARLKVTDFVVSRMVAKFAPFTDPSEESLRFLSPEQIQEAEVTGRSDQFALGTLAYLLLTGMKPFDAEHLPTLYYRICKEEPKEATVVAPTLSAGTSAALNRAMAKSPNDRFSSCSEFVRALTLPDGEAVRVPRDVVTRPIEAGAASRQEPAAVVPVAPEATLGLSGERAYLLPEKSHAGRKLAIAFILGILIGAGVWVNRYWKASAPVPVQVADPKQAPSSPPPETNSAQSTGSSQDPAATPKKPAAGQESATPPGAEADSDAAANAPAPSVSQEVAKSPPKPEKKAADSQRASTEPAQVRIVSDPVGARIVVDDDTANGCVAPCSLSLAPGRHTLMATQAGAGAARRIFTVPAEEELTVVLPRVLGTLLVASSPSGAEVMVDGVDHGRTPASVRLPAGVHHLVVVLNGDLRAEQNVAVEGDQIVSRTIRW